MDIIESGKHDRETEGTYDFPTGCGWTAASEANTTSVLTDWDITEGSHQVAMLNLPPHDVDLEGRLAPCCTDENSKFGLHTSTSYAET